MLSLYTTFTKITLYLAVYFGAVHDNVLAQQVAIILCWYYTIGVMWMPFMPESFKQYVGQSSPKFYIFFDLFTGLMIGTIMHVSGNELTGATFVWQAFGLAYVSYTFHKQYYVKKVVDKQPVEVVSC